GVAEGQERKCEMMQEVDHDDVGGAGVRERKRLGVRDAVEPRRGLNVGRDHVGEPLLEVADAAADFDGAAASAGGGDAIVEILVDEAQNRLALPDAAVVRKLMGWRPFHPNSYRSVIPAEPRERREPESIITGSGYGFRFRGLRPRPGMTTQNLCWLVASHRLDAHEREQHHAQQHEAVTETGDLSLTIGAAGIADGDLHRLEAELGSAEDQLEIPERIEVSEITARGLDPGVVGAPQRLGAAQRVGEALGQQPSE